MPSIITAIAAWAAAQAPIGADLCDALSVRDAIQTCANREQYLYELNPSLFMVVFNATTIGWVAPVGAVAGLLFGYGGGGGGGGGRNGTNADNQYAQAGAGGGAAQLGVIPVPIVGGDPYNFWIGAGGAGGAVGNFGFPGGDSFAEHAGGVIGKFQGASPGAGTTILAPTGGTCLVLGGLPWYEDSDDDWVGPNPIGRKIITYDNAVAPFNTNAIHWPLPPGSGGASVGRGAGRAGRRLTSQLGAFAAGAGGPYGGDSASKRGGGGGGGGGAGPGGAGGDGSSGGLAAGLPGQRNAGPGTSAAANSGAGGGGGGGGAAHATTPGTAGAGGAGGSGRQILVYGIKG